MPRAGWFSTLITALYSSSRQIVGGYVVDARTAGDIDGEEAGMISHASRYAMTPPMTAAQKIERTTHTRRTAVLSIWKYSARPPHTPASCRSVVDRLSRRCTLISWSWML